MFSDNITNLCVFTRETRQTSTNLHWLQRYLLLRKHPEDEDTWKDYVSYIVSVSKKCIRHQTDSSYCTVIWNLILTFIVWERDEVQWFPYQINKIYLCTACFVITLASEKDSKLQTPFKSMDVVAVFLTSYLRS